MALSLATLPASSFSCPDFATSIYRPLSATPHRPLRNPRPTPRLQLNAAKRVLASLPPSPASLERGPAAVDLCRLLQQQPSSSASASDPHSRSYSPLALLQSLEETFQNSPNGNLCKSWRDYHGCRNWAGLLDPLDPDLRGEIIKYGDLAQLTYDAFDHEKRDSLHKEQELLEKAGLTGTGYTVTKYIYASSDVHILPTWLEHCTGGHGQHESNWMGFVAVATDEKEIGRLGRRDIVVVWRGTVTRMEWLENIDAVMVEPQLDDVISSSCSAPTIAKPSHKRHVGVERGFYTLYTACNEDAPHGHASACKQVRGEVRRLVEMYKGQGSELSITMTGHSLGGALALLAAYDVSLNCVDGAGEGTIHVPVSVISFAAPRVGNEAFKLRLRELGVSVLRVVNINDAVPKVPGILVHEGPPSPSPPPLAHDDLIQDHHPGKLIHIGVPATSHHLGANHTAYDNIHDDHYEKMIDIEVPTTNHHLDASHDVVAPSECSHKHTLAWNTYVHVGMELCLDNRYSPFLKKTINIVDSHNLELYLHLIDGYRSAKVPFIGVHCNSTILQHGHAHLLGPAHEKEGTYTAINPHHIDQVHICMRFMKRDVTLVNKTASVLLDELHVEAKWQERKLPKPSPRLSPSTIKQHATSILPHNHIVHELLYRLTLNANLPIAV